MPAPAPIPILLDTDIGDDIDDALALAVALNSPELSLAGITTVYRDAPRRAILAHELLKLLGREDVPVHAGCSEPLFPDWENVRGGREVGRQFEALDPSLKWTDQRHGVDFIIEQARGYAGRGETLTLGPIGALTNIALAFQLAPDIVPQCKVVLMGGKWSGPYAETNIRSDPEAAAMVFGSGADLAMVGLEVTMQCLLTKEEERCFHDSPHAPVRFLGQLIDLWGHPVALHDPLTVLAVFSDVVNFAPMRIEIGLQGEETRSRTTPIDGEPNVRVAVEVDVARAKSLFLERVLQDVRVQA